VAVLSSTWIVIVFMIESINCSTWNTRIKSEKSIVRIT
jgi:hypothetical protein